MEIIFLLAELIPCLLIGYLLGRFKKDLSLTISRPLMSYGIPVSLIGILLKSGLEFPLIQSAALALVAIGFLMTLLNRLPVIKNYIPNRTLQLGSAFGNTGYFGIPVSLALLPSHALIYSIGYDLGATLLVWTLGPILLAKPSSPSTGQLIHLQSDKIMQKSLCLQHRKKVMVLSETKTSVLTP